MAFALRHPCASFLQYSGLSWVGIKENRAMAIPVLGIRFYRGSNRNKRKRERNERARQRKREGLPETIFDKKEFFNMNYDTEFFAFKNRLSLVSMDDVTLKTALTHESYENKDSEDNSKLALIGYNIAMQHITESLYFKYPSLPSEGINCLLEFLTSREATVKLAESIALHEVIRTEYDLDTLDEEKHINFSREDIISDAFYALIGAIYKDKGSQDANVFIKDFILTNLQGQDLHSLLKFKEPEKLLDDILLSEGKPKADGRILKESGKKTLVPVFVVGIFSGNEMLAEAASYNITNAKQEAILAALMKLFHRDIRQNPTLPSHNENVTLQSFS